MRKDTTFSIRIAKEDLDDFIIAYNECFREYYALCDRINEEVLDNAEI